MLPGARIFDVTAKAPPEEGEPTWALELASFGGPEGGFFADRGILYSANGKGLVAWNPETGERVGQLPGFSPTHQHGAAHELALISEGWLIRWSSSAPPAAPGPGR